MQDIQAAFAHEPPHISEFRDDICECIATNRKVAGSIPDGVIELFHWLIPSERTMALGSTQPLTEMSSSNISWG